MARIPLNGPSYEGISVDINYQRTVNWYVETDPSGKDKVSLLPTPGLDSFTTAGAGAVRASKALDDTKLFIVSGNTFYEISPTGTVTSRGTLTTSAGRVEMDHNGVEVLIVDGTDAYIFDSGSNTFSTITNAADPNYAAAFPAGATSCVFIDSFFIVNDPAKTNAAAAPGAFFLSGVYDGLSWNALDYQVAENKWDQIEAVRNANGQLWLVGSQSTEVWYNSGNGDFPFEPIQSAIISTGTAAGATAVEVDEKLVWLTKNDRGQGMVVVNSGYNIQPISDSALNNKIAGYIKAGIITDAFAFSYQINGHTFYVLTFPTANKTWVYDFKEGGWFQWSYNGDNARHISNCYAYFNGEHVVGSATNGKLWTLNETTYDDDGTTITRLRQSPHLHAEGKTMKVGRVEILFEQGVGNVSFPDPQAMLQWSKDRGHTWSSENWRDVLGAVGEYSKASTWRQIGKCHDIIFRLKITDGVKPVVVGAYGYFRIGTKQVT